MPGVPSNKACGRCKKRHVKVSQLVIQHRLVLIAHLNSSVMRLAQDASGVLLLALNARDTLSL